MDFPTLSLPRNVTLSGLAVAGLGFGLTRFTVTLAAYDEPTAFYLAGLLPLVLGLLLAAFGVALVVGPFEPAFVRTTTAWCLAGAGAMAVLVVLTLLGSNPGDVGGMQSVLSKTYLSNFLIGGSVGGTLTGVYAARNRRHRGELRWQANRLVTLNRILRHEVLNSITAIACYADVVSDRDGRPDDGGAVEVIQRRSDHVVDTIENVQYLTESARSAETTLGAVDLVAHLQESVESVRERYPDAEYVLEGEHVLENEDFDEKSDDDEIRVWANSQLSQLFEQLLENAVEHSSTSPRSQAREDAVEHSSASSQPSADNAVEHGDREVPRVEVTVETDGRNAVVRVADDGPGLPERERSILEDGAVAEHDNPSSGFGVNVVRLLVERYHGDVRTTVTDDGTTVEVTLVRAVGSTPPGPSATTDRAYGIPPAKLSLSVGAGLVAGVAMGLFSQTVAGVIPVIGALYGVAHPVVGWITHEFHSVVFGMTFAGLLTVVPGKYADGPVGHLSVAVGWGLVLWAVAAGVVMPLWLRLVGISAQIPNLGWTSLAGHLVWAVTLGGLYYLGSERLESASE